MISSLYRCHFFILLVSTLIADQSGPLGEGVEGLSTPSAEIQTLGRAQQLHMAVVNETHSC